MLIERPDLDGLRLYARDHPDVWLVFSGRRHRIASPAVYDAMFSEIDRLVAFDGIEQIALGDELCEGSCLVRADGALSIYLLTMIDGEVRRHFVPTYETLCDFGFAEERVREIPPLLLEAVPAGRDLVSASSRELG